MDGGATAGPAPSPAVTPCLLPTCRALYSPCKLLTFPVSAVVSVQGCTHPPSMMDKNTSITISDRKKSLEAQNNELKVKTVKVEYESNFSIKPLIDFFNRTFRRDVAVHNNTSSNNENIDSNDKLSDDHTKLEESFFQIKKSETNEDYLFSLQVLHVCD